MNQLQSLTGPPPSNWHPDLKLELNLSAKGQRIELRPKNLASDLTEFFYLADYVISSDSCQDLIHCFSEQKTTPVGVDGYSFNPDKVETIGSYRANAWSKKISEQISMVLAPLLQDEDHYTCEAHSFKNKIGVQTQMPVIKKNYYFLGSTPYLRFMKYADGGKHVPHYDAPYICENYVTLMSWVLYLNTPDGSGGAFQFIDDGQGGIDPALRNRSDWNHMASSDEILYSIPPKQGRLLVFPHWLPHQVDMFKTNKYHWRMIIRGDVAYGW